MSTRDEYDRMNAEFVERVSAYHRHMERFMDAHAGMMPAIAFQALCELERRDAWARFVGAAVAIVLDPPKDSFDFLGPAPTIDPE